MLLKWRLIDLPSRSTVIDLPIEARHVPNFFVEATLVRDGRLHTEARELFVPPVKGLLNVAIRTDKPVYQPGETGKVSVTVTDLSGEPVRGQVVLTAYDRAVTYIQDEFGPSPRVFYYGQKRYHTPYASFSADQTFGAWGSFECPEGYVGQGGEPEGWGGWWRLEESGLSLRLSGDINGPAGMSGGGGTGGGFFGANRFANALGGVVLRASASPMSAVRKEMASSAGTLAFDQSDVKDALKTKDGRSGAPGLLEPEVRVNFADTALWVLALTLDANGRAETEIRFSQSLTTWRLHGYALTQST